MPVEVAELACREGHIGLITLNEPGTLNALTEPMVDQMQQALNNWAKDTRICLVVLQGAGERAFCAGGNIKALYPALKNHRDPETAARFFTSEYRLDFTLHRFPKPVIGLAGGIVMGGGLGLLSACRYRLIHPNATLAMPEISIGLFPDVGASWFLNRLPGRLGLFMGLTGARLNVTDALRVGLADMVIETEQTSTLLERLQQERWSGETAADDNRLFRLLNQLEALDYRALAPGHLEQHEQTIARLSAGDELPAIVAQLLSSESADPWWQACIETLRTGCPVTAWLVWNQLRKGQQMSLKDVFRMELAMARECIRRPDLAEGIRALLVDKDRSPRWSYTSVAEVPEDIIERHFLPVWDDATDPMALDSV
ncbi:enoyl-CoA hydratase/isomerase family protein [Marinobacter daepoensis]|uniref:3-hydroxyisobutyryl-CoA hydrolase n=1 Tax=Marinobacter daepoensis TaxID=262077 RepID=A0ABS3BED0_9GAMM|nr:enoyl-CoA hydratase/isomerase family protein [Marinobacter daepoensis]MBN7770193.1 enoyl-CoA hydratase/isomerase family protein [Marinobacter daepoensis]MBY6079639.1 enoyl-CoA hydratase/isomerase family protein [Marinobacter daepoensis]